MSDFVYQEPLPLGADQTPYRLLTSDHVSPVDAAGKRFLRVEPEALTLLAREAMRDIAHLLRPGHLAQLARILADPEASANDRFVALELLKNANIAAAGVLPGCQDTGTAIVMAKKGQYVLTEGGDEEAIARGVHETYTTANLRYSQLAPLDMYTEVNTGNNLPAQIEIYATDGDAYKFLFLAKGGGSANKSFLYQETKALLNPESLLEFLEAKLRSLDDRSRGPQQRGEIQPPPTAFDETGAKAGSVGQLPPALEQTQRELRQAEAQRDQCQQRQVLHFNDVHPGHEHARAPAPPRSHHGHRQFRCQSSGSCPPTDGCRRWSPCHP